MGILKLFSDCFLEQAYHKYRISVAKCKKSSLPERIMVAYSGGNASQYYPLFILLIFHSLLLHFTQLARLTDPQRKNLDKFIIVCISFGYSEEQKAAITKAVSAYGLFCEFISLSKALYGEDDKDGDQKLEGLFKSCKMETTKVDLLCIIKRVALILTAMQRDCSKIYLGETCSSIAVKVLADTCTGRGISIPWMLSPSQRYFGLVDDMEVTTIRPLRELVNLEVDYYLSLTEKDFTAAPIKSTIMTEPSQSNSSPNSNPNPNPKSILELTKGILFKSVISFYLLYRLYFQLGCRKFCHGKHSYQDHL